MLAPRSMVAARIPIAQGRKICHLSSAGNGRERRNSTSSCVNKRSDTATAASNIKGISSCMNTSSSSSMSATRHFSGVTVTSHEPPPNSSSTAATAGAAEAPAAPSPACSFSPPIVDLRSDTVTKPCKRLRAAMSGALVGDDVYGEDPTVTRLEECVAHLLGKEKGLLVPSGTMGNLIAVGAHCRRGDEIILGDKSHIFKYEGTGASAFMGVSYHTIRNNPEDAGLDVDDIEAAVRADDPHYPRSSLLCLENTQNLCGARAIGPRRMAEMCAAARGAGLKVHVDGARLWNAAISLEVRPSGLVPDADSVSVCLSKGLGAPLGSVLVGSEDFIYKARRLRKALGGGMRQAGVIASAGLEAVVNNYNRLAEDHENAEVLAKGLGALPGIQAERPPGSTNAVYFQVTGMDAQTFVDTLKREYGVLMGSGYFGGSTIRAMTHLDVNREGVERVLEAARMVLAEASQESQCGYRI